MGKIAFNYLLTLSRPRIAPRALHVSKFSWGGPPNPPQGEVDTHKYSVTPQNFEPPI